jgi:hypothetical protein
MLLWWDPTLLLLLKPLLCKLVRCLRPEASASLVALWEPTLLHMAEPTALLEWKAGGSLDTPTMLLWCESMLLLLLLESVICSCELVGCMLGLLVLAREPTSTPCLLVLLLVRLSTARDSNSATLFTHTLRTL